MKRIKSKLENATTGLQGNSLKWVANLTIPICKWNEGFIDITKTCFAKRAVKIMNDLA